MSTKFQSNSRDSVPLNAGETGGIRGNNRGSKGQEKNGRERGETQVKYIFLYTIFTTLI